MKKQNAFIIKSYLIRTMANNTIKLIIKIQKSTSETQSITQTKVYSNAHKKSNIV